jgi:hypothetical protein
MRYIIFLLLSITLLTARAKSSEEVVNVKIACYHTDMLLEKLRGTYKEYPMIMGITNDKASSTMSVWINSLTKTWTIVATKETVSCVIGSGTDLELVPYKKEPML